jgi:hypothetical protein
MQIGSFEGYPFDGPEDREAAMRAAMTEQPSAKVL